MIAVFKEDFETDIYSPNVFKHIKSFLDLNEDFDGYYIDRLYIHNENITEELLDIVSYFKTNEICYIKKYIDKYKDEIFVKEIYIKKLLLNNGYKSNDNIMFYKENSIYTICVNTLSNIFCLSNWYYETKIIFEYCLKNTDKHFLNCRIKDGKVYSFNNLFNDNQHFKKENLSKDLYNEIIDEMSTYRTLLLTNTDINFIINEINFLKEYYNFQ